MALVFNSVEVTGTVSGIGLSSRRPCRLATTSPGTLATSYAAGQSLDGFTLALGDRILIKDQASGIENGVYSVNSVGAPSREDDFDEGDTVGGSYVFVRQGTVNSNTGWLCINDELTDIVNTHNLAFARVTGSVDGSGSSTDNAIVRWDGTTGTDIQNSAILIDDSNNITGLQYLQFSDISAPANANNGEGRLYKKTGNDGLFWKPDSAGVEVDLTAAGGGGESNTVSNVGSGDGWFKQKTGVDLEFKSIVAGSNKLSVANNTNDLTVDVVEANINHDALTNFVANEHIDHSSVTLTAGVALVGGGDITTNRTFDVSIPSLTAAGAVDKSNDLLMIYDASAMQHYKIIVEDLLIASNIVRNTSQITAVNTTSTTSSTFVDLADMSLTTGTESSTYIVYFTANMSVSNGNGTIQYVISAGGVDQAASTRDFAAPSAKAYVPISVVYRTPILTSSSIIKIRWRKLSGPGTIYCRERILLIDDL